MIARMGMMLTFPEDTDGIETEVNDYQLLLRLYPEPDNKVLAFKLIRTSLLATGTNSKTERKET